MSQCKGPKVEEGWNVRNAMRRCNVLGMFKDFAWQGCKDVVSCKVNLEEAMCRKGHFMLLLSGRGGRPYAYYLGLSPS